MEVSRVVLPVYGPVSLIKGSVLINVPMASMFRTVLAKVFLGVILFCSEGCVPVDLYNSVDYFMNVM